MDVVGAFPGRDSFECICDCVAEGVIASGLLSSEPVLELCEELLDGVQVGAICRQEEQVRPCVPDGRSDGFALVTAEIVEDYDVAGLEGRDQSLLDPGAEALSVDRAVEQAGGFDAVAAQRSEEGVCPPAPMRRLADQPLSPVAPSPDRRHVGLGPGLVEEDQPAGIDVPLMASPAGAAAGDLRPVLLQRERAFF